MSNIKANAISTQQLFRGKEKKKKDKEDGHFWALLLSAERGDSGVSGLYR